MFEPVSERNEEWRSLLVVLVSPWLRERPRLIKALILNFADTPSNDAGTFAVGFGSRVERIRTGLSGARASQVPRNPAYEFVEA